jgi:hypothetical protein
MSSTRCRFLVVLSIAVATLACDDGPTTPTPIGTPTPLNLSGTWAGLLGPPGTNFAYQATWTATQSGNNVQGTIALLRPSDNVSYSGTLSGTLNGTALGATFNVPRGNVPSAANCTITGLGTLTASASLMSGRLNLVYTNCATLTAESSATEEFSLTKQ